MYVRAHHTHTQSTNHNRGLGFKVLGLVGIIGCIVVQGGRV
jgi:hypothetical protein